MNNNAAGALAQVATVFPFAKSNPNSTDAAWRPYVALRNKGLTTCELQHATKMFDKLFNGYLPAELSKELDAFEREFAEKYSQPIAKMFEPAYFICAQA